MTQIHQSTDLSLHTAVVEQLRAAPEVTEASVGVSVDGGAVALSGEVRSYDEKRAALRLTLAVPGVSAVADGLSIADRSDAHSDSRIAVAVARALKDADAVPPTVQAVVHDQAVTLSGQVATVLQRVAARQAVESIPGLIGVWSTIIIVA